MKPQVRTFTIHKPEQIYPTLQRLLKAESYASSRFLPIPFHLQSDLFLSFFEAIQNAFQHGGAFKKKEAVRAEIRLTPRWVEGRVFDRGPGFKFLKRRVLDKPTGERGRGLAILKQLNDRILVRREAGEHCLIFRKKILPPAKRYRLTELLYEISRRLTEAPNLQKVYDIVLDQLIKIFNVERASLMIYDPGEAALKVVAARGIRPSLLKKIRVKKGHGISGAVFQHSRPLLMKEFVKTQRASGGKSRKYRSRSFISAPLIASPLKVGEETLGVINLTDKLDGSRFTPMDLKLLTAIAGQVAAYIRIGALIERLKNTEWLERDLEIVREIQKKLTPTRSLSLGSCEISGESLLSQEGGGDYFDVMGDEKEAYLVVADVSGHRLPSALTMANFRSAFRALYLHHPSPRTLLATLNEMMFEDLAHAEHFICVALVCLQFRKGLGIFAGAGSIPLFLFREGKKTIQSLASQGFPLGIERGTPYHETRFEFKRGDGFLLCTDGVLEFPLSPEQISGVEKIKRFAAPLFKSSPQRILREIKAHLGKMRSLKSPPDDMTFLVAKRK